MSKLLKYALFSMFLLFASCASVYRTIVPEKINYAPSIITENLNLSYRYDVLRDAGNKKFVKNEFKRNMKVVAVKLTNNSDSIIDISKDVTFYCGGTKILLMNPIDIKQRIQQTPIAYGLYLIGCISLAPLDIAVFGGIGFGNMLVASNANKKLLYELVQYDITNKQLKKGESVIGIVGFESLHSDPITVTLNN